MATTTAAAASVREVLSRLERVKGSRGSWTAKCPTHDDGNPSLSVSEGAKGVLLHCHAGCSFEAIAAALGFEPGELFHHGGKRSGSQGVEYTGADGKPYTLARAIEVYDYFDAAGELAFKVGRFEPKAFRPFHRDAVGRWQLGMPDSGPTLFRLPEIIDAVALDKLVHIAEGEKDVLAIERAGGVATTNPFGADSWRPEYAETLRDARVRIVADRDEAGRDHARTVAESLEGVAESVELVEAAEGNDPADHFAAGHGLDDFEPMQDAEEGSDAPDLGLRTLREILKDPKVLDPPEPVADRLVYRGYSSLFVSREKLGKSTAAGGASAAVSAGSKWLGSPTTRGHVLYLTLDESPRDTVRRLVSFGADKDGVTLLTRLPTPGDPLGDVEAAAKAVGPDLIVVDTLAEFVRDLDLDSGDAGAWTPIIGGLSRVARDHDAGLLLLHHTKKSGEEYRDSTAIGASVDLILLMKEGEPSDVRKVEARGRLPVEGFSMRLRGDPHDPDGSPRWSLTSGELSLDARILLYVERHAGASTRDVREGVTGRTYEIGAALDRLLERGALVDRGTGSGRSLYAPDSQTEVTI